MNTLFVIFLSICKYFQTCKPNQSFIVGFVFLSQRRSCISETAYYEKRDYS